MISLYIYIDKMSSRILACHHHTLRTVMPAQLQCRRMSLVALSHHCFSESSAVSTLSCGSSDATFYVECCVLDPLVESPVPARVAVDVPSPLSRLALACLHLCGSLCHTFRAVR